MTPRQHPPVDDVVDYLLGELGEPTATRLEEHVFACAECAGVLESIERIAAAVRDAVRHSTVGANVTGAFLRRAADEGVTLRQYRLEPGQTVACSAGWEDLFVVRLRADFGGCEDLRLRVEFQNLEDDTSQPAVLREVHADNDLGEVVLVFPGEVVRGYPRSLWTLTVEGETAAGRSRHGPFVLDHSP